MKGSLISAFVIGVILFWSFGRNWLRLESVIIFLAGLLGVALAVSVFGIWNLRKDSHHKQD